MKKRFSDIQVGDIVYYVYPRHTYFEICDLELVEKKSDSEYKFHRKIATDYMEYNLEINTERIYTHSVYGKNSPFVIFADKEVFLKCLKRLNQMIKEKITYYERVKR